MSPPKSANNISTRSSRSKSAANANSMPSSTSSNLPPRSFKAMLKVVPSSKTNTQPPAPSDSTARTSNNESVQVLAEVSGETIMNQRVSKLLSDCKNALFPEVKFKINDRTMLYSPIYNWFDCETKYGLKPVTNISYQFILCDSKKEPLKPGNLVRYNVTKHHPNGLKPTEFLKTQTLTLTR